MSANESKCCEQEIKRNKKRVLLEQSNLLPFRLEPSYRDYIWGGNRLRPEEPITAEAWLIYENNKVLDGVYSGSTLGEVALAEGETLLGHKTVSLTGKRFPLLIKILDSQKWLSLQVHPNNDQAERLEGQGHFGKMEGWYIIDADEGSQLISGFKEGVSQASIRESIGSSQILELVAFRDMKAGDYLMISPGTIHALGPGLLVYEVQQTSDLTYRVYDWDRPQDNKRKLHIEQAKATLDTGVKGTVYHQDDVIETGSYNLFSCPYFDLHLIAGKNGSVSLDTHARSFSALTVVQGQADIIGNGWHYNLNNYESLLIPAVCSKYSVGLSGKSKVLYAFVGS